MVVFRFLPAAAGYGAVVWGGAARYVRLPLFLRAEARPAFRLPEMVCRLLFQVA
jgi:hypothetical protein